MRRLAVVLLVTVLGACHRAIDVSGLYVNGASTAPGAEGTFFPCDQPKTMWRVSDSTLAVRYSRTASKPYELVFARLRGVRSDSGSVYGGAHYFRVRRVIELRARRPGECPVVDTVAHVLGSAAGPS
jgi:hypothetical protein